MSLPPNWTTIPVTATYTNRDGTPASGWVTFESRQQVIIGGVIIVPKTITAVLDGTGAISATLPSTNDPELSVGGWAYLVTEHLDNGGGRAPFMLEVPYTVASLNLATVSAAVPRAVAPVSSPLEATALGVTVASQAAFDSFKADLLTSNNAAKGEALVAVYDPIAPAYLKTTSDLRNGEEVNVLRGIPRTLHSAIRDGSNTTALSSYLNALLSATNTAKRGELYIPDGDFLLDVPLVMKSRTRLRGAGSARSRLYTQSGIWPASGSTYYALIRNENYAATGLTDEYLTVEGLRLDYTNTPSPAGGGLHAFTARMASNIRVIDVDTIGGENGTALLACSDTRVIGCTAVDPTNCGFDHWDGAGIAKVIGCTVRRLTVGRATAQGIMFTADSSAGAAKAGYDIEVIGNTLSAIDSASASAILINAVAATGSVKHARIVGNHITDCSLGVVLEGAITNATIQANTHNAGGQAVVTKAAASGSPSNVAILGNSVLNPTVAGGDVAAFSLAGDRINAIGNTISGTSYPYAFWLQASNSILKSNNFATGTSGRILNAGSNNLIEDDDVANGRHDFAQKLRTPAIQFGSATSASSQLDYYDEGTWTPTDQSGAALTLTASGNWTRVGNLVTATCQVVFPATANGSNALIGGLPFAQMTAATSRQGGTITFSTIASAEGCSITQGGTTFAPRTSAGASITNATLSGGTLFFTLTYMVD